MCICIVLAAIVIPLSCTTLDGNMFVQDGAAVITIFIIVSWIYMLCSQGLMPASLPAFGPAIDPAIIGVILFNFDITYSVPCNLPRYINTYSKYFSI